MKKEIQYVITQVNEINFQLDVYYGARLYGSHICASLPDVFQKLILFKQSMQQDLLNGSLE